MAALGRILVVDDDELVREVLGAILAGAGYEVLLARGPGEALTHARAGSVAVALVDRGLGDASGIDLCRQLRALADPPRVLIISGATDPETQAEARAAGALDLIAKPFSNQELLRQLEAARRGR